MDGTRWTSHGAPLLHAWTKLSQTAGQGSSTLTVRDDVSDWYVGGSVVITQTSNPYRPDTYSWEKCQSQFGDDKYEHPERKNCNFFWENEVRVITGLESLPGVRRWVLPPPGTRRIADHVGRIRHVDARTDAAS